MIKRAHRPEDVGRNDRESVVPFVRHHRETLLEDIHLADGPAAFPQGLDQPGALDEKGTLIASSLAVVKTPYPLDPGVLDACQHRPIHLAIVAARNAARASSTSS